MQGYTLKVFFSSVMAGLLSGCATSVDGLLLHDNLAFRNINEQSLFSSDKKLDIQYLGVGGYLFQYGDDSIMTAPSFTNPGLVNVSLPLPIETDTDLVDKLLPIEAKQAEFILVGHAHYDHLMDVPYIMQQHMPTTIAVGSTTMTNIVTAVIADERLFDITDYAAEGKQPGTWIYNRHHTIRFMPIKSDHAPHFMGIKVMSGTYQEALTELPSTAYGWKEGQTYAYVIDFLDNQQQTIYRIHYQDAASNSPDGLMPVINDTKAVDMAILCVAAFHQVDDYPEAILQQTQPKTIVLGHWEDFFDNNSFNNQNKSVEGVRMTNIDDFIQRVNVVKVNDARLILPVPFSWIQAY
ncbi:MBL fold metallo-hydrolase [Moritella viscosa]|uniref:Lipoprotein n=1 Tax=Moritella viscosa TaxID=80854 RepID=A0ABY1HB25_9GAMM|nr:hypothetical protein [Moritella viscosa]CED61397.1 putative lipoprotein [Moritella viscosa]SGY88921.1 Putative uncharacterized protein [Moritella viscosa]SGY96557.1 Putative uncharacterized protein [Moritella viscosa]SHO04254.1 Putative uncharacterized protein [Moritella viscosa]SHO04260.1 Putative uncharacterized protein [Moritella viscosa]